METYKESEFSGRGMCSHFCQDNESISRRGVLRGLHFQRSPHAQAKLVRVVRGAVWDVAVDLRQSSTTRGRWYGVELSSENRRMLYVPEGFAHGFLSLQDGTRFIYKCSREYRAEAEGGVRWDDPDIAVDWPFRDVVISPRDAALPLLRDLA